jgi:DNA-binding NarL/FixJ family response regulator
MNRADTTLQAMRADAASDWPSRLLDDLADAPLLSEEHPRIAGNFPRPFDAELGPMELLLLKCMSRGMTRQMAADATFVSVQTVMTHLKGARYRLGAKNTTQACCEAIRRGLIP